MPREGRRWMQWIRKRMSLTAKTGESFVAVVANHPGKNVGEEEEDAIDVPCNHAVWPHA